MKNYEQVPNIISCKDLDYLSDMFEWNYSAYKNTYNAVNEVDNKEIKDILLKGSDLFNSNMKQVLSILGGNYEQ